MHFKKLATAVAIATAALAATSANAAFVIGGTSFGGGFNQPGAFTNLPNSIVSGLTSFSIDATALAVGSTGNFNPAVGGLASANSFNFATTPVTLFTDGGFTFTILSFGGASIIPFACNANQCTDTIGFSALGQVSGNGFQTTGFTMSWSAQGSCNESPALVNKCGDGATGSWSASISATGSEPPPPPSIPVPEPTSLALVGLALAGVGFTARRRAAK